MIDQVLLNCEIQNCLIDYLSSKLIVGAITTNKYPDNCSLKVCSSADKAAL